MILCASPYAKKIRKAIYTLKYGAKAKYIIRSPHTPDKIGAEDYSSAVILGSRITAMDDTVNGQLQLIQKS